MTRFFKVWVLSLPSLRLPAAAPSHAVSTPHRFSTDVDLVWTQNPLGYLQVRLGLASQPPLHRRTPLKAIDITFVVTPAGPGRRHIVHGRRRAHPRYTPFFVNSGFYFVKYNPRTLYFQEKMMKTSASEIGRTHSHQSVLIRHLAESHHLAGLKVTFWHGI